MKLHLCAALLLISCFKLQAQHQLSGTITDIKQRPLLGVTIYIHDLKLAAQSDSIGKYNIKLPSPGTWLIEYSLQGYQSELIKEPINKATTIDVSMRTSATELHEVVVTGSSSAISFLRQPLPVSMIQRKQLEWSSSANIIDALTQLPGIHSVSSGPNISKPVIRGLGGTRVLTLFNGIRQEGQQWGEEHGIEIDEFMVDHVEIIKGPASLIYGSDALGGIVNLLPSMMIKSGETRGDMQLNYQSNAQLIAASAGVKGMIHDAAWGIRMSHKLAQPYSNTTDGRVYGTSFKESDLNFWIGINQTFYSSQVLASIYDNTQGVPTGDRDSATRAFTEPLNEDGTLVKTISSDILNSYDIPKLHQHIQHFRIQSLNKFRLGTNQLILNLGWQQSNRIEFSHPEYVTTPGLALKLNSYTWDLKWTGGMVGIEYTAGLNGMIQLNQNVGTEFLIPDYFQHDIGAFIYARREIKRYTYHAGIRYDHRLFKGDALYSLADPNTGILLKVPSNFPSASRVFESMQHQFNGISASAGMTVEINKAVNLKSNLGMGYRAPNVAELSASGVHPGTGIHQTGSSELIPEQNIQGDLGLFIHTEHLNASIEGFANYIDHYLYNQKMANHLGQDSLDIEGFQFYKYTQSTAFLYGGELALDFHPHPYDWLHIENASSIVITQVVDSKSDSAKYLPFTPPLRIRTGLRIDIPIDYIKVYHPYIRLEYDHYAAQNRVWLVQGTETVTPYYGLVNVGAGIDWKPNRSKYRFKVLLNASNLLDIRYQSHLSRLKYMEPYPGSTKYPGIYGMGRNFTLKLIFTF